MLWPPSTKVLGLARRHESVGLQVDQAERREVVVEHERVDVARFQAGAGPQVAGSVLRLGHGQVRAVDDSVVAGAGALGRSLDQGQGVGVAQFPGALGGGHDHGGRAVVLLAEVKDVQRVGYHAGVLVVVDGDGVPAQRPRIAGGMLAEGDGDPSEVVAGGPVLVHVAADEHAEVVGRGHAAPGRGKALRSPGYPLRAPRSSQPHAGAEVGGPETHHVVGVPGGDGGGGVADGGVTRASAIGDGLPVTQVLDAQRLGQQGLVV